jgi:hypothetical protein
MSISGRFVAVIRFGTPPNVTELGDGDSVELTIAA